MLSVLIVDDDSAIRSVLIRSLERRGCTVASAANGLEGLNAIRRGSFDVVISDVNMPRRGGLWLREKALALRPELRGRFLLISAEPLPRPRSLRLHRESLRFVLKPFLVATLWSEVQKLAEPAERSRQRSA
jgi:two-component system cell cycle sensor histidine kinase/response regulator CckA